MYGLKQSPRCWQAKLTSFLATLGFLPLKYIDESVFRAEVDGINVLLCVYVDDELIVCENSEIINKFLKHLGKEFPITSSDPTTMVIMEIERPHPTGPIKLHQRFYIEKLVERFGVPQGRKKDLIPMDPNLHLSLGPVNPDPEIRYRELIGGLLYTIRGTRPDLAYAVDSPV